MLTCSPPGRPSVNSGIETPAKACQTPVSDENHFANSLLWLPYWPVMVKVGSRAASARIGVAEAARLPTFTITGQYGSQSSEFAKWFSSETGVWQAFAGVSIPLFTEGRPGGEQVNIARARAAQARSRYEQTVLVALQIGRAHV